MKYKQWKTAQRSEEANVHLRRQGVPALVAAVLCARGLGSKEQATSFLSWHPNLLCDPFLMKDMERAVSRIRLALDKGERIAVYGDYDVDGITSTCLLTHYLRSQGGEVCFYIPCRLGEGYGVNREAIDLLQKEGVTLIITVDCGITAVDEADYAKSLGIDMVITDHHECKDETPRAVAVLDPHQKDCNYPFKDLAGVGVALKLVLALAGQENTRAILEEYSDLAAVGTVADVMKLLGENRTLVNIGLKQLKSTHRIGLAALMEEAGTVAHTLSSTTVGYCLAPRINAAGRMGRACMAAELILTDDPIEAQRLSKELCELNRERQNVELQIFNDCTRLLDKEERVDSIVLADEAWHQGVVGIVASRLSERYACPVFMISLQDGKGKGSCRSYGGFNLFQALEQSADLLEGYGGHALAAGFTILEEKIPEFRERIAQLVSEDTGGEEIVSTLDVDVEVSDVFCLTVDEVSSLSMLEPYGNGNPKPVFALMGVTITCMADVGGGRHLKLRVCRDGRTLDVIFFSTTRSQTGMQVGDRVDLAFYPQVNEHRGSRNVQLHLVDLRPSEVSEQEEERAIYERFCQGHTLPKKVAGYMIPEREEFKALWRYLTKCGGTTEESPESLARNAAQEGARRSSVTRTMICLEVLEECGLIHSEQQNGKLRIHSRARAGVKMDLEQTSLMRRLRKMAGQ